MLSSTWWIFFYAKYKKANLPAIVRDNCSHLQASDREKLLSMLLKFELLFDDMLGDWNLPPVSFELKEAMKPYPGLRYTLPVPTLKWVHFLYLKLLVCIPFYIGAI